MQAVVAGPAYRITKQVIGLSQGLEPGRSLGVVRLGVGMCVVSGLPVGAGNVLPGCTVVHA
jgi:hypothetical protein